MSLVGYARVSTPEGRQVLDRQLDALNAAGCEGVKAARARGRKGGRPRIMTPEKLRYAQSLMADRTRSIPDICRELGDLPSSTLYHYLQADGTLKGPGQQLLAS